MVGIVWELPCTVTVTCLFVSVENIVTGIFGLIFGVRPTKACFVFSYPPILAIELRFV
jgi:hypothetical protein